MKPFADGGKFGGPVKKRSRRISTSDHGVVKISAGDEFSNNKCLKSKQPLTARGEASITYGTRNNTLSIS